MFKTRNGAHVKFLTDTKNEITFEKSGEEYVTSIGKRQGESRESLN